MEAVTLWHNPDCSKSRAALALLRERGIEPAIRNYLIDPPAPTELRELLARLGLGLGPRELMRTGQDDYLRLGLDDPALGENELIDALSVHPQLIERPILVVGERALIARPPERIVELFAAG